MAYGNSVPTETCLVADAVRSSLVLRANRRLSRKRHRFCGLRLPNQRPRMLRTALCTRPRMLRTALRTRTRMLRTALCTRNAVLFCGFDVALSGWLARYLDLPPPRARPLHPRGGGRDVLSRGTGDR
eukprot:443229-Rhodomonas_salina.2